jgi:hypothetical protein
MRKQLAVFRTSIGIFAATLSLLLLSAAPISAQDAATAKSGQMATSHVLDGKTFVTVEEEPDELVFKNGTFFSATCAQWGFEPSPVIASADGDVIRFETESISPKHGKMAWQGTVDGKTMNVSYEWTKKRWYWKDAHQLKEFQATLKEP